MKLGEKATYSTFRCVTASTRNRTSVPASARADREDAVRLATHEVAGVDGSHRSAWVPATRTLSACIDTRDTSNVGVGCGVPTSAIAHDTL